MKKILIPIDFSKNSLRAMEYGLQLAEDFGSSVTLFNASERSQPGNLMAATSKILEEEAQIEMRNISSDAQSFAPTVEIQQQVVRGQSVDTIIETAKKDNYDLIIMGTKGASGLKEVFIGSIANKVITQSEVPVIIVPVGCTYRSLQTVVLSLSDDLIKDSNVIAPLANLVKKTGAKLEVYHFGREEEKAGGITENLDILDKVMDCNITYAYDTDKKNINVRIRDFAQEKQAGLICLIRRKRNFWATLFGKSVTSNQTFHSNLPLLILQNEQ